MTVVNRNIQAATTLPGIIQQMTAQYELDRDENHTSNTNLNLGGLYIGGDESAAEAAVAIARLNGVIVAYIPGTLNGTRNWKNFRAYGPSQAVIWLLEDLLLEHYPNPSEAAD